MDKKRETLLRLERQQDAAYLEWRKKNRSRPPKMTPEESREFAIRGLERMVRFCNEHIAAKVEKLLVEARDLLQRYALARAEVEELPSPADILRESAEPVAAALRKYIGGFRNDGDAIEFVLRYWPLTDGRAAAQKAANRYSAAHDLATDLLRRFWDTCDKAARTVTGGVTDKELAEVIKAGRL